MIRKLLQLILSLSLSLASKGVLAATCRFSNWKKLTKAAPSLGSQATTMPGPGCSHYLGRPHGATVQRLVQGCRFEQPCEPANSAAAGEQSHRQCQRRAASGTPYGMPCETRHSDQPLSPGTLAGWHVHRRGDISP